MKTVNATPPANFPKQVIVFTDKTTYLRVQLTPVCVETVDLNEVTLPGARRKCAELGYSPTHWMRVTEGSPHLLP